MIQQPTKQQIHTFFDVVNHLANHENKQYEATGQTIFPGLPRPIPEVVLCMQWLHGIITQPELSDVAKEVINRQEPVVEKKKPAPWNKGKKKEAVAPKSKASATKKVVGQVDAALVPPRVPTPEELPMTILKPGPAFEYAEEVKGAVLIVPDDPEVLSNPK